MIHILSTIWRIFFILSNREMIRGIAKMFVPMLRSSMKISTISLMKRTYTPAVSSLSFKPIGCKFMSTKDHPCECIKELKATEDWEKSVIKGSQETPVIAEFYAK